MVLCDIYFAKSAADKWIDKKIRHTASGKEPDNKHAERLAYKDASAANQEQEVYLFVQDEFPCEKCRDFFTKPNMPRCIFVCKGSGTYAGAWGLQGAPMPQVIYTHGTRIGIPGRVVTQQWVQAGPNPWEGAQQSVTTMQAINATGYELPQWALAHPSIAPFLG